MAIPSRIFVSGLSLTFAALLLGGCGAGLKAPSTETNPVTGASLHGQAYGGQQPVSGSVMQLYAASTSGYGLAASPLIAATVKTNATGGFDITGDYTCPSSSSQVYITATGGNPGGPQINSNLMLMAALGSCGTLVTNAATTFIQMNEVTTVASAYALSGFMTGATKISSSANNANGLAMAFSDVNQLVNLATGYSPGLSLPSGATFPVAEINTLANILAACVNSIGGTANDGSTCGKLFAAATPAGGSAPTDTLTAIMNIAQHPGNNVSVLYPLSSPNAPFAPALTSAPNDWTLAINYSTGGFSSPSSVAIAGNGNVWVTNSASNTVTELTHAGTVVSGSPFALGLTTPSSVALDTAGGPWIAGKGSNSLIHLSSTGVASGTVVNGGLNSPSSVALDASGNIWAANSGSNVVSEFTGAGTAVSPTGFTGSGVTQPLGIAISSH